MNFFPSLPPPPPFSTTSNSGATDTTSSSSSSYSSSSSTSITSSIVIVSLIISSAIIISASIYILLRFLSRRRHPSSASVIVRSSSSHHGHADESNYTALNSLPTFTFGSVNGNLTGGDCAVCLSKFHKEDKLRLLPLCCHAFHTKCIDTWLLSNQTCPLCRSTVYPTDLDVFNKINSFNNENSITSTGRARGSTSFRIEIGSISRRRGDLDSGNDGGGRRSYSVGSFEYVVDVGCDIVVVPGESLESEVGGGGSGRINWVREYVDRLGSVSLSFRSSGRFFIGSSRRSDVVVPVDEDLEAVNNRTGEEISEVFRWISGV